MSRKKYTNNGNQSKDKTKKTIDKIISGKAGSLQEEYEKLDQMDKTARIAEIQAEMEGIKQEISDIEDRALEADDEEEALELEEEIGAKRKSLRALVQEKKKIESFEAVKEKLAMIAAKQEELKTEREVRVNYIKAEIAKQEEEKAELERYKAILEEEMAKLNNEDVEKSIIALKMAGLSTYGIEAEMAQKLGDLEASKKELDAKISNIDVIIKKNNEDLKVYEEGRSEIDKKINMCKLPWENLLNRHEMERNNNTYSRRIRSKVRKRKQSKR